MAKCSTKSSSSGNITDENKQEVETTPSAEHQQDFIKLLCELTKLNKNIEKMLVHLEIITDEEGI